eukprot:CAMPEP_0185027200 /NCGR_PEP_ID=MMETSP1103-20130426/11967_1 /TAXON_ID=36769 /ORGANISM="Paraphysomonas bandaiensis, Strain Caron Lab Isolate" /LENGTH=339 /DNA_ID=CAMNT_0027561081 /DNA_START=87 /DNA_END=1106 /DNA_ORIENTATION=-
MYGDIPDIQQYLPHTDQEIHIQAFNCSQIIPNHISSPSEAADWLLNTSELNKQQLYLFLGKEESVLGHVASSIVSRKSEDFVECFREFLCATGAVREINNNDSSHQELQPFLGAFAKALIDHEEADYKTVEDWELINGFLKCVLSLNIAILSGQEAASLPEFFSAVRKLTRKNASIFAPRRLTEIYNALRQKGAFIEPSVTHTTCYLLANPILNFTTSVSLNHMDSVMKKRHVILTRDALYMFMDSSRPVPFESIPLAWVLVSPSERDPTVFELSTRGGDCTKVPLIHYPSPQADKSISFHSVVFMKFLTASECDAVFDEMQKTVFFSERYVNVSAAEI